MGRSRFAAVGALVVLASLGLVPARALAQTGGNPSNRTTTTAMPTTAQPGPDGGAAPEPGAAISCTTQAAEPELVPVVLVADTQSSAEAAASVSIASELQVIAHFQLAGPSSSPYTVVPDLATIKSKVDALPIPHAAYVVLAVASKPGGGQDLATRLNEGQGTFGDSAGAFVIDGTAPANRTGDAIAREYDRRVETAEIKAIVATRIGDEIAIDSRERPKRTRKDVGTVNVLRNGAVVGTCAATSLPFTIPASHVEGGDRIRVTVNGVTLASAELPPMPQGSSSTTQPSTPDRGSGSEGIEAPIKPGDDTSVTTLILLLVAALAIGAGVVFFLLQRRPGGGVQPATAGPWNGGGSPPPPSPHGPSSSPSAFSGAGPGGYADAGGGPVAPVGTGPSRRTEAPAFTALDLTDPAPGWTGAVPGDGAVRLADLGLMRVLPVDRPSGRTWSTSSRTLFATAGWLEKKPGQGEDAEPTLRIHESGRSLLGVYDGVGGAGSGTARRLRDGTKVSGAYVGARLARDLLESWYGSIVDRQSVAAQPDDLRDWLQAAFRDEADFIPDDGMNLRGSLSRVLPTTLAAIAFGTVRRDGNPVTLVDALWAGDSRAYLLTPDDGLQVLSIDDTRETDALELIRNDQPMENLVSAGTPFVINHRQIRATGPLVLVTATDGCFGYVKTPAHFEYLLLRALQSATSVEEWSAGLLDTLAAFTGDDATFAIAASGFEDLADVRAAFRARLDFLDSAHWKPFEAAAGDPADVEVWRDRSWTAYRERYHALVTDEA